MKAMTLARLNTIFKGLREIAPSHVVHVFENFCDLDFERVSLEQDYFAEMLAYDYLFEFCSGIELESITYVQNLSNFEFLRGYVALCQLVLKNVESVRTPLRKIPLDSRSGIPHTLVLARIMSSPIGLLESNPSGTSTVPRRFEDE